MQRHWPVHASRDLQINIARHIQQQQAVPLSSPDVVLLDKQTASQVMAFIGQAALGF
jgi:ABC-type phosphate/phosphonate transport system ATPase subunit